MSSLLGNTFSLAGKTKAGIKPSTPNTSGEEERPNEICSECWGGCGLRNRRLCHGSTGLGWAALGTSLANILCLTSTLTLGRIWICCVCPLAICSSGQSRAERLPGGREQAGGSAGTGVTHPATDLPKFPWTGAPSHRDCPGASSQCREESDPSLPPHKEPQMLLWVINYPVS